MIGCNTKIDRKLVALILCLLYIIIYIIFRECLMVALMEFRMSAWSYALKNGNFLLPETTEYYQNFYKSSKYFHVIFLFGYICACIPRYSRLWIIVLIIGITIVFSLIWIAFTFNAFYLTNQNFVLY